MVDLNQCIKDLRKLTYLSVGRDAPVYILFESPSKGFERCVIKIGSVRVFDYSKGDHKEPEEALRELIHKLEARHGRPHE